MKSLVFDTSSIISLATNNLLWIISELKKRYNGQFYLCNSVKRELVDNPLQSKKYKFEALTIMELIKKRDLELYNGDLNAKKNKLLDIANNIFKAKGQNMSIVHDADMESLALAIAIKADAYVVDERTTRLLIEDPKKLSDLFNKKLHTDVNFDNKLLKDFQNEIGNINVLRSADLMTIVYEKGLLDKYVFSENLRKSVLEGVLWGVKLRGCSISIEEIDDIIKMEGFRV
ncbi:MAG: hypothetical protein V1815_02085 [Candidatus Woesearchaeota archaeon]